MLDGNAEFVPLVFEALSSAIISPSEFCME